MFKTRLTCLEVLALKVRGLLKVSPIVRSLHILMFPNLDNFGKSVKVVVRRSLSLLVS